MFKRINARHPLLLPILIVLVFLIACFDYFSSRYVIAYNKAISDCLYSRAFLIDTWDKTINEGELIAFEMNVANEFYAPGMVWVKRVATHGSKTVMVTPESVDSATSHYNLSAKYVLRKLHKSQDELQSTWALADDELFMIGETLTSYDSRFWGPIKINDVKGRAYALF